MFKIWGVRQGMIGDSIMSLPVLNFLDIKYPNSYKYFAIGKKFSQSACLYINHPKIDKIHILENDQIPGKNDFYIMDKCQVVIDINPQHENENWYTQFDCVQETFKMAGFSIDQFNSLESAEKKPRLYQWWHKNEIEKQSIAIFPFAGYGANNKRSPSFEWWKKLIHNLNEYKIYHFGFHNEPTLSLNKNYFKLTNLSFFEMIKLALTTKLSIGTDSGSSWVIGAYGHPQINLLTDTPEGCSTGLVPSNYYNTSIDLFASGSCDNIPHESVIQSIKNLCN